VLSRACVVRSDQRRAAISARRVPEFNNVPSSRSFIARPYSCSADALDLLVHVNRHGSLATTRKYLADVNEYLGQNIDRVSTGEAAAMILARLAEREAAS
jgi:hypothetical protein